jgi:hypothetical protein
MKVHQLQALLVTLPPDLEIIIEADVSGPESPRLLKTYTATGAKYHLAEDESGHLEVDLHSILVLVPGEPADGVVIFPE